MNTTTNNQINLTIVNSIDKLNEARIMDRNRLENLFFHALHNERDSEIIDTDAYMEIERRALIILEANEIIDNAIQENEDYISALKEGHDCYYESDYCCYDKTVRCTPNCINHECEMYVPF